VNVGSNGVSPALPGVCKTPAPPAGPIPIPSPNLAVSSDTHAPYVPHLRRGAPR
jgi:hypothetical protein